MQSLLSRQVSIKFRFWMFVSILMVVMIHAYNLNIRYLQPFTIPGEPLTLTSFTEYFLSNGIFRFVVPLFFLISGYLFALSDNRPHKERLRKRVRVVLVPYLTWSAIALLFVFVLEMFPATRQIVTGSQIMQISSDRFLLHDYHWYEVLARWILIPVAYQLWFLRVLIIYNIAYPALRWCVMHKTVRWVFFGIAVLLWLINFDILLIEGEGLLFFSLGIWMQKTVFNINRKPQRLTLVALTCVWILLCTGKTWLAFNGLPLLGNYTYPVLTLMHKLSIVCALMVIWWGSTGIAVKLMSYKWFAWLSDWTFIIFVLHAPAIAIFTNPVFAALHYANGYRLITYVLLPFIIVLICVITGFVMRRFLSRLYAVATGGR